MKKRILVVTLLAAGVVARAQDVHVNFGIKGGVNVANLKFKNVSTNYNPRTSFHVGGLAHIHKTKHFALQPELMFSGQGAEYKIGPNEYKTRLGYINLPVLFQYMTGSGFRLQTGPQLGVLVSATSKVNDNETHSDIKDSYEKVDFSWAFGASYVFPSGVGIDARYNLGLNNISDMDNYSIKNRVLSIGAFYQFKGSR